MEGSPPSEELHQRKERLEQFRSLVAQYSADKRGAPSRESLSDMRARINREAPWARRQAIEAGCFYTLTITPPPIVGGLIATVAMIVPAASLMYVVTLFWQKAQKSKWRVAVEKGFAPLTVGLIMATSLVMSRTADHDWRAYLLTAVCTAIFVFTKTNPLLVVGAAGVIGYFGII